MSGCVARERRARHSHPSDSHRTINQLRQIRRLKRTFRYWWEMAYYDSSGAMTTDYVYAVACQFRWRVLRGIAIAGVTLVKPARRGPGSDWRPAQRWKGMQ